MKYVLGLFLLAVGCATSPSPHATAEGADAARGPWSEVPTVEMPTGDTSIPIALLRDVADALLKRPGAKVCEPLAQRPIVGLSTEYCSTIYVAGNRDSLSWRVTEPATGNHEIKFGSWGSSTTIRVGRLPPRKISAPGPRMHSILVWPWRNSG